MQLTKHRNEFTLTMSSEELVSLVNLVGSDPQNVIEQEKAVEILRELTKFKVFYESLEKYLQEQEALLDK